ncbi:MAG: cyanophycinase [Gammaproteobacteria bacterium]|nr:cyanophycinase [Gammaproteobacteria bacterium]
MLRFPLVVLFLAAVLYIPAQAAPALDSYRLMLAGGGIRTCSSMVAKHCTEGHQIGSGRTSIFISLTDQQLALLDASSWLTGAQRQQALKQLRQLAAQIGAGPHSLAALTAGLREQDRQWLNSLDDRAWFGLVDLLEIVPESKAGAHEQVALTASNSGDAIAIYQTFVAMAAKRAGGQKPRILVITASARDPFEAADFYQQVFAQAGADSHWLPLDGVLHAAWRSGRCDALAAVRAERLGSFRREAIYGEPVAYQQQLCRDPELLKSLVGGAHGVFLNGGDQSLTRAAFIADDGRPAPWFELLQQRFAADQLVVGGTSAGTAVQAGGSAFGHPVPMISNGDSRAALARGAFAAGAPGEGCERSGGCGGLKPDDLTYLAAGGLGLFNLGVVDTHFSERARHPRLAVLQLMTGVPFGVGVDENTALLVAPGDGQAALAVVGENGVWLNDVTAARRVDHGASVTVGPLRNHYLQQGDRARLDRNGFAVTLAAGETLPRLDASAKVEGLLAGDRLRQWLTGGCFAGTEAKGEDVSDDGILTATMSQGADYQQRLSVDAQRGPRCSYSNLGLTLRWQRR